MSQVTVSPSARGPLRATVLYFIPTLASALAPVITLPIITRHLRAEDFGVFAIAQALVLVLNGFLSFGIPVAFERGFHDQSGNLNSEADLAWSCAVFLFAMGAVMTSIGFFFEAPILQIAGVKSAPQCILFYCALSIAMKGVNQIFYTFLRFRERAKLFASVSLAESVMAPTLSVIAVVGLKMGIRGFAVAQVIVQVVLLLVLLRISFAARPRLNWEKLTDSLKVGAPLLLRQVLNALTGHFDKLILGYVSTTGLVGIYYLAERMAGLYFASMTALGQVFIPELYKKMFKMEMSAVEKEIAPGEYLTPFFFVSSVFALTAVLFSREAFWVLAPDEYGGAESIAGVLVLSMSFLFFSKVHSAQFLYAKQAIVHSAFAVIQLALIVGISVPATKNFGIAGTAWATFASRLVYVVSMGFMAQRCYKIKWPKKVIAILFGYLTMVLFAMHFTEGRYLPFGVLSLAVRFFALAIFFVLGWKMGMFRAFRSPATGRVS